MFAAAGLWLACASAVAAAQATRPAAFDPAQLTAAPISGEARLGAALVRATRGEFEAAAAATAELLKGGAAAGATLDDALKQRLERERTRLEALAAARREFLERCVKEQRKLHLKQGDKSVAGAVVELTADHFVVADAKGRRVELPLAALEPDELLKKMAEQKLETGSAATRSFAALLAGRKLSPKGLDAAGEPDSAALKGDAPGYPALLATGRAVLALEELARAPPPAAGAPPAAGGSIDATLAAIHTLLAEHGREAVVTERLEPLKGLARAALAIRFDARGIAGAGLHGEVAASDGGGVRLHYEWKSAAELDDFADSAARHPSWSAFEIKLPKAKWTHGINEEALTLVGEGCLRHRVEFAAPVALEYEVEYSAPAEGLSAFSTLRAAICDDGEGTMVTNLDLTAIDAYLRGRRILESSDPGATSKEVATRVTHSVRLEDDGKEARLAVAERPEQKIAAPEVARGGVALYWKSDSPIVLRGLTIEGRLAPDGLATLREAAVARELAALFGK